MDGLGFIIKKTRENKSTKFKNFKACVEIKQTWTKIDIKLQTDDSISNTKLARIDFENNSQIILTYVYEVVRITIINKQGQGQEQGQGTGKIIFDVNKGLKQLKGTFYNENNNHGEFTLNLKKNIN